MTIKYFCDVCGIEVSDPSFSLDMTGKILCRKHFREHEERNKKKWVYTHKDKYRKNPQRRKWYRPYSEFSKN